MSISIAKGGNVSLSKEAPGLTKILIGLGWDTRATDGADFDLDASAFLVGESGKVRSDADFIFYNQLKSSDGSVEHTGGTIDRRRRRRRRGDQGRPQPRRRRGSEGRGRSHHPRRRQPQAEFRHGAERLHPRVNDSDNKEIAATTSARIIRPKPP